MNALPYMFTGCYLALMFNDPLHNVSLSKAFLAKTHDHNPASFPFRLYGITLFSSTLSSSF